MNNCPNCGKSLTGMFSSDLIKQASTDYINKYLKKNKEAYCSNCSVDLLIGIRDKLALQKSQIENYLISIIHYIPILTGPPPSDWKFTVLDMVNSQTTSGTGFITELSRSFNDIFGKTSNSSNTKIVEGLNVCKADLRMQCVRMGGNAIYSTDIDFSEVGSGSTNMLMICMAGTAIKLKSFEVIDSRVKDKIEEITDLFQRLESINK